MPAPLHPCLLLAALLWLGLDPGGAAQAHHGWGWYDATKTITITGKVTHVLWTNPHVEVQLQVGEQTYRTTLAPPWRMLRRGVHQEDIQVGDRITIQGHARRTDAFEIGAERITIGDQTIEMR